MTRYQWILAAMVAVGIGAPGLSYARHVEKATMRSQVMTLGMWRVKPGHQEEFIASWKRLGALFAKLPHPPSGKGTLLQSTSDSSLFYSFGSWSSPADIEAMRADPKAQAGIAALKALCTEAVPGGFRVVAESP